MNFMKIVLDGYGGDNSPYAIIDGAILASNKIESKIIITGNEDELKRELKKRNYNGDKIEIADAKEVITNYDKPTKAVVEKPNSSLVVGLKLIKDEQADAFVSCGSTGAILAGSIRFVGRAKGVNRPALATFVPTKTGVCLVLDVGATTATKPLNLLQYAQMGEIYIKKCYNIENPRVALLSNGTEETKGSDLVKEAYPQIKDSGVNFIGNIEARQVPFGVADVVVCDGFSGNVMIKAMEGFGVLFKDALKEMFYKSALTKISALLVKKELDGLKKTFDYSEYGGAPLLGLKKPIIKAHGSSNAKSVYHALIQAENFIKTRVIEEMSNILSDFGEE